MIYWSSKIINDSQKWVDLFISDLMRINETNNEKELLQSKIDNWNTTINGKKAYKTISYVESLCNTYNPTVDFWKEYKFDACNNIPTASENNYKKKLYIRVYGAKEYNYSFKTVRTWDGDRCLWLPIDILKKVRSWFKTDSKNCRKFLSSIMSDIFVSGSYKTDVNGNKASIDNLFSALKMYIKRNEVEIIDQNEIDELKTLLKQYFIEYEKIAGNQNKAKEWVLNNSNKDSDNIFEVKETTYTDILENDKNEMQINNISTVSNSNLDNVVDTEIELSKEIQELSDKDFWIAISA